jgi:hypothetical protein
MNYLHSNVKSSTRNARAVLYIYDWDLEDFFFEQDYNVNSTQATELGLQYTAECIFIKSVSILVRAEYYAV